MTTQAYMMVRSFPNGMSYQNMALYASDETALAGCKQRFRDAQPGDKLVLIREGGDVVFSLERPLALEAA
jgi:hypothetical protein